MSAKRVREFRSSGQHGYVRQIVDDPRHRKARKLEREVQVRFADADCIVKTREGAVLAHAGDAIITGVAGEHWRVSRARFADKYRPKPPGVSGAPGAYLSRRYEILALQMNEPFEVVLADGVSRLAGSQGDWLVDYGDGSMGVVAQDIFSTTYELLT